MKPIRCSNCGLVVQVPPGGRRLCGCGTWLAADDEATPEVLPLEADLAAVERLTGLCKKLLAESAKIIVGQRDVLEQILITVLARGHALLVGVPGLAKTLMIRTIADAMNLTFSRIQFTPDLMPSDITGTEVLQEDRSTGQRAFRFLHGPLFANVILADEINRTPPKTQAALLEAMQERQVTAAGTRHKLPDPFFVLATQNPIEQEGTYPLPEAQLDRFMLNVRVDYPDEDDEYHIVQTTTSGGAATVERVVSANDLLEMQDLVRKVPVAPYVIRYALKFTRATRKEKGDVPDFVRDYVTWGAGPRASQFLVLAAKARAVLQGRPYVSCEDVRAVAAPVLRHRILTNFNAEADGVRSDDIVRRLIEAVPREAAEK
ncbi:MAG TPA: MoxR family ATPase [Gemmataceae bacterium]|jgi:MoxR-like ATPase|nr:MoxR family ATPase [Gemmataceae bacterium]